MGSHSAAIKVRFATDALRITVNLIRAGFGAGGLRFPVPLPARSGANGKNAAAFFETRTGLIFGGEGGRRASAGGSGGDGGNAGFASNGAAGEQGFRRTPVDSGAGGPGGPNGNPSKTSTGGDGSPGKSPLLNGP